MSNVKSIVDGLSKNAERFEKNNLEARHALLAGARSLVAELETANEYIVRTTWAEPARNACLRMALDNGLLAHLPSPGSSGQDLSCHELAKATGVEEDLTGRIMRHLAAMDVVKETGKDRFAATTLSKTLVEPRHHGGMVVGVDVLFPAMMALPGIIAGAGNKSPTDRSNTAFQKGMASTEEFYQYLGQNEETGRHFMMFMTGYRHGMPKWYNPGFYPVQERLGHESLGDDSVLIVDIGGGIGTDIMEFYQEVGNSLKGRIILQDVPPVLEVAKSTGQLDSRIECMGHDFNTPQPVQGARAYHMHSILHNWPDKECNVILKNIAAAMRKDYSKLLIFENVIPEVGARWTQTAEDFAMSSIFSARERSASQWAELLKPHGLKITGIWSVPAGEESVIEAVLE